MTKKLFLLLGFTLCFLSKETNCGYKEPSSWTDIGKAIAVGTCAVSCANIIGKQIISIDSTLTTAGICGVVGAVYAFKRIPKLLGRKNTLSVIAQEQINIDHAVTNTLLVGAVSYLGKQFVNYCNIPTASSAQLIGQITVGLGVGATIHWIKERFE